MNLKSKIAVILSLVFLVVAALNITVLILDVNTKERARLDAINSRIIGALTERIFTDISIFEGGDTRGSYGFQGGEAKRQQAEFLSSFKEIAGDDVLLTNIYDGNERVVSSNFIDFENRNAESLNNTNIAEILSTGKKITVLVNPEELYPTIYWNKPKAAAVLVIYFPITISKRIVGVVETVFLPRIDLEGRLAVLIPTYILGLLFGFALLSYFLGKYIISPILLLQNRANRIAQGDYTKLPRKRSSDEVGRFNDAFDEMSSKLENVYAGLEGKVRARTKELETLKNSLEEQVRTRTIKLEQSQEALTNMLGDLNAEKKLLAEAEAKDQAMISSIGDGLFATDDEGRIKRVNSQLLNMLGFIEKEIVGEPVTKVMQLLDLKEGLPVEANNRPLLEALITGKPASGTFYIMRKNGTQFAGIVTASPILLDEKPIGVIETIHDATHEVEVDKAKSEFVSLASHQLRTPLSTIGWYAEMLLAGDAGKVTDEQKKYLEEVYHANQRMVDLVNTLLNVSRLELGTFMVEPKPTNIVELAEGVIKEQKLQIDKGKINFSSVFGKDIPIMSVDAKLLRMVFQNLLSNAVKYTQQGGNVSMSIFVNAAENNIVVKFSDNGYGIPKNQQDRIFGKLFRADNVREKETEGTGLGLYIVKSIIDQSRGKIWFESEENKGTTFYVSLPLSGMPAKSGTKELS